MRWQHLAFERRAVNSSTQVASGQSLQPRPELGVAQRGAPSAEELQTRRTKALAYCEAQIAFFTGSAKEAHWLFRASQVITSVLSAMTPILLLSSSLPIAEPQRLLAAAVLSSIVAVVTGLNGAFHWQEQWVRSAYYREKLSAERNR